MANIQLLDHSFRHSCALSTDRYGYEIAEPDSDLYGYGDAVPSRADMGYEDATPDPPTLYGYGDVDYGYGATSFNSSPLTSSRRRTASNGNRRERATRRGSVTKYSFEMAEAVRNEYEQEQQEQQEETRHDVTEGRSPADHGSDVDTTPTTTDSRSIPRKEQLENDDNSNSNNNNKGGEGDLVYPTRGRRRRSFRGRSSSKEGEDAVNNNNKNSSDGSPLSTSRRGSFRRMGQGQRKSPLSRFRLGRTRSGESNSTTSTQS